MKADKITVVDGPNKEGKFTFFIDWIGNRGPQGQIFKSGLPIGFESVTVDERAVFETGLPVGFHMVTPTGSG